MSKIKDCLIDVLWNVVCYGNSITYEKLSKLLEPIDEVKVKVFRERNDVRLPEYAKGDTNNACMDIYAHSIEKNGDTYIVHTGLHFELPKDYEMEIRPRSSICKTYYIIPNSPGTVDCNYRGEVTVWFKYSGLFFNEFPYKVGDRIAQLIIRRREKITFDEVQCLDSLSKTERDSGGYGSTGK